MWQIKHFLSFCYFLFTNVIYLFYNVFLNLILNNISLKGLSVLTFSRGYLVYQVCYNCCFLKKDDYLSKLNLLDKNPQVHVQTVFDIPHKHEWYHKLFYKLLFGCPTANFGPWSKGQLQTPKLMAAFLQFWPEGHWEPRNSVRSLSATKSLMGYEPGTIRF